MKICIDCLEPKKSRKGKYCKSCGYKHRLRPRGLKYIILVKNKRWFKKGNIPCNKGVPNLKAQKSTPGYDAIHDWVERWAGKAKDGTCDHCNGTKNLQWANKSHKYHRDLNDWARLCKSCHFKYDRKNGWGDAKRLFPRAFRRIYV